MTTKEEVRERLAALREVMRSEGLGVFIIPSTDPHNGEYVPRVSNLLYPKYLQFFRSFPCIRAL